MILLKHLSIAVLLLAGSISAKGIDLTDGDQVAIMTGQSFEMYPWSPSGYMRLLTDKLESSGIKKSPWIFLENQKTAQMLDQIDADVIAKKPVYVLIIPGTSDYNAWTETSVDPSFRTNLEGVLEKLKAANIKAALMTSYAITTNLPLPPNQNVSNHNDEIRALAQKYKLPLIDFVKIVDNEPRLVPFDGNLVAKCQVHQMLAGAILHLLGYSDAEVSKARQEWLDKPGAIQLMPSVSANTYEKLKTAAAASGKDIGPYMTGVLHDKAQ